MLTKRVKVLKRDQVDVEGTTLISPFADTGHVSALHSGPSDSAPQQARIVQSNEDFAILEIVCDCGCKSHIQCHYANA